MYRGIGWKTGESFGCSTKPLAQYMLEVETTRTVDENIIHKLYMVCRASFSFISLENVFAASSFFSRLTKTGPTKLHSFSFSKQLQFKSKENETYSRMQEEKI